MFEIMREDVNLASRVRAAGRGCRRGAGVDAVVRVPELPERPFRARLPGSPTRCSPARERC